MSRLRDAAGALDPALLRLMLISDGRGDFERLRRIIRLAVGAGVRWVQLREPLWNARMLVEACEVLRPLLDAVGGVLLVNDRVDVALTGVAHGVQIGQRSIPAARVRDVLGDDAVLCYSAHDRRELELAVAARCDAAMLAPVWPTSSKPGAPHLGVERARELSTDAGLPVVWLGGIDIAQASIVAGLPPLARPAGIAVRSAICAATDPGAAAAALLRLMTDGTATA